MGKQFYATGRGGAGNIAQSDQNTIQPTLIQKPQDQSNNLKPIFSTGRGGRGNIHKNSHLLNDDPAPADPDHISPVTSAQSIKNPTSFGRGGYFNVKTNNEDDISKPNETPLDSQVQSSKKKESSGLLSKVKKIFK